MSSEDLAEELEDVDFADAGNAADDGWETEDEMESEQDDSELTFSKHTGEASVQHRCEGFILHQLLLNVVFVLQVLSSALVWTQ